MTAWSAGETAQEAEDTAWNVEEETWSTEGPVLESRKCRGYSWKAEDTVGMQSIQLECREEQFGKARETS